MESLQDAEATTLAWDDSKTKEVERETIKDNMIAASTPPYMPSSPPPLSAKSPQQNETISTTGQDSKSDSEAETVLLPSKDGYSPSKSRNLKLEDAAHDLARVNQHGNTNSPTSKKRVDEASGLPHQLEHADIVEPEQNKNSKSGTAGETSRPQKRHTRHSSGLSSVPSSPELIIRTSAQNRGRINSESSTASSLRAPSKNIKSEERESMGDDKITRHEAKEQRTIKRRRTTIRNESDDDEHVKSSHSSPRSEAPTSRKTTPSASPESRPHRRSLSTQTSTTTSSHKRRRAPGNLRITKDKAPPDKLSDEDSSAGDSPPPQRVRVKNLATPPIGESLSRFGKKKRLMQYGTSPLGVACIHGDLNRARKELDEHPEDLNSPDNAGNTPLQVAALNGFADLCSFLISKNCEVHCSNKDKDSPLLDAVENGHLDVVRILLAAGVNPRARNLVGVEPVDRIGKDCEDADEIRSALLTAASTYVPPTLPSRASSAQYPNAQATQHAPRATTHGRARQTGANQLYLQYDEQSLAVACAQGDEETVCAILEVMVKPDVRCTINAVKGGHSTCLGFLIALGNADPDPEPLKGLNADRATPMLAAIGGDNIEVVKVLLSVVEDRKFNPRRKHDDKTYYEIARERKGPCWQEEERLLKEAYDNFSPAEVTRRNMGHRNKPSRTTAKEDEAEDQQSVRHRSNSTHRLQATRSDLTSNGSDGVRKGFSRSRNSMATDRGASSKLEREGSPPQKLATRRKLITGKERARERRASAASNKSGFSTHDDDESTEILADNQRTVETTRHRSQLADPLLSDRSLDRARVAHRSTSQSRVENIRSESPNKRARASPSPSLDGRDSRQHQSIASNDHKRRRLGGSIEDLNRGRMKSSASPERLSTTAQVLRHEDERVLQSSPRSRQHSFASTENKSDVAKETWQADPGTLEANHESQRETKDTIQPMDHDDLTMMDIDVPSTTYDNSSTEIHDPVSLHETKIVEEQKLEETRRAEEASIAEEAKERREREQRQLEQRLLDNFEDREKAEALRQAQEDAEEEDRLQEEEAAALRREEHDRLAAREEAERREAELREEVWQQQQLEEQKRQEIEEQKQQQMIEDRLKQMEEENLQQVEAQKLQEIEEQRIAEQLQAEALEQLRKREEQERRIKEHDDAQRAEAVRIFRESEEARLVKLPPLLRWLDQCLDVKTSGVVNKFRDTYGVRYDTINLNPQSDEDPREWWLVNTDVALLLGEKDLNLSQCESNQRYCVVYC